MTDALNVMKIVNENVVQQGFCVQNVTLHTLSYIVSYIIGVHFKIKLTVRPIVAHGVKADRLFRVRWKDILDVHNSCCLSLHRRR